MNFNIKVTCMTLKQRTAVNRFFFTDNLELNDLRIIICLRKSEVPVERISVCNLIENGVEHGIHCLPCSYTNEVINMQRYNYDVVLMSN